jgi:hypothetical protein
VLITLGTSCLELVQKTSGNNASSRKIFMSSEFATPNLPFSPTKKFISYNAKNHVRSKQSVREARRSLWTM